MADYVGQAIRSFRSNVYFLFDRDKPVEAPNYKGPILSMMSHKQLVVMSCSTYLVLFITIGSSLRLAIAEGGMTKSLSYVDNIQN